MKERILASPTSSGTTSHGLTATSCDGPPEVEVYDDDDASKPAVGSKLNRPAIVTLLNVGPGADASEAECAKWSRRVEKATKRMGASLVDFDPVSGVWKFKTPHF